MKNLAWNDIVKLNVAVHPNDSDIDKLEIALLKSKVSYKRKQNMSGGHYTEFVTFSIVCDVFNLDKIIKMINNSKPEN